MFTEFCADPRLGWEKEPEDVEARIVGDGQGVGRVPADMPRRIALWIMQKYVHL